MTTTDPEVTRAQTNTENALMAYARALSGKDTVETVDLAYVELEDARDALVAAAFAAGAERVLDEMRAIAESHGRMAQIKQDGGVATAGTTTIRSVLRTTIDHVRAAIAQES